MLLPESQLPDGFAYPPLFLKLVELGLVNLEPWWVIKGELLVGHRRGLVERYPDRDLVPFARRQENDDVACWDRTSRRVYVVHDFASAGWEQREEFADFAAWLRSAIDDFIDFDALCD